MPLVRLGGLSSIVVNLVALVFLWLFLQPSPAPGMQSKRADREERAIELLRQNRVAEARAELEAILKEQPDNQRAAAYLAAAELEAGEADAAIARTRRLLEADPENTDLRALLARAYMADQDWERSEKEWRAVLGARPNSEEAHAQLAQVLLQLGRFEEGLGEIQRAIRINPRRSDARALHGNLLASLGRGDEAVEEWNAALRLDANNVAALAGLAAHLRERSPDFALECARRAVELSNWGRVGPIRILVLVYRSRGELDRAREVLEKALAKFPDNPLLGAELQALRRQSRPAPKK